MHALRGIWGPQIPQIPQTGGLIFSFPINFHSLLDKIVTFSRTPGGPRGLKYQIVPKLRSFRPIGKPRERFQS